MSAAAQVNWRIAQCPAQRADASAGIAEPRPDKALLAIEDGDGQFRPFAIFDVQVIARPSVSGFTVES
jgi:hypothetical protein